MMAWVKEDAASGRITAKKANEMFNQLGATEAQRAPDQRSDEQRQLDAAFPPAKPGENGTMTPQLKEFDQSARTWLSGAQFPREVGNSLVSQITKVLQRTHVMTEEQLNTYGENEYVKLQRIYGDQLEPRLRQSDAMVASLLIAQAKVYWAKQNARQRQ